MWGSASVCVPSALLRIKVCGLYFDYATLRSVTVRGGFGAPFPCSSVYSVVKNGVGDQGKFAINLGGGYCLTCGLLVVDNVEQMGARVVTFCPVCVASSCTLKTE